MPVGCLGVSSRGQAESSLYLDTMGTLDNDTTGCARRQAESIEIMQQRLLIQIFRVGSREDLSLPALTCVSCDRQSGRWN